MKLNRIIASSLLIGSITGLNSCKPKIYNTGCETYQGYHNDKTEGYILLVFDDKEYKDRGLTPSEYTLIGNPKGLNRLNRYELEYSKRIFGQDELISATACKE
ncbi:MAG TPA: hypothetical protein VJH65_01815 [Candidatus Nanoarchaeia archaeon]|nr:hypothetical protein [Candidatus Nanoarchaeia archaeon]